MPENEEFFQEQSEQSAVKTKIVASYFSAWSRVMKNNWPGTLAYIDLFCGPGRYSDNAASAPVKIINDTLMDPSLSSRMRFIFNDMDPNNIASLQSVISEIDTKGILKDRIQYHNETIAQGFDQRIRIPSSVPVLSFVDPFGYKGLTLDLINKLISTNGSDCIFFFNYNRINMSISNTKFDEHLVGLFGENELSLLKQRLLYLSPEEREPIVLKSLIDALMQGKSNYVLPFKFYGAEQLRTSHFIVFVTKHPTACKIMKTIMYQNSAKDQDGVALFRLEDRRNFASKAFQLSLLEERPLVELKEKLAKDYSGKEASVGTICNSYDTDFSNHFVGDNVKEALRMLEKEQGLQVISGRKIAIRNGKICMPDKAVVRFATKE